jgi:threonylcarbamoyladenosine tRNA methylthiotransferase MtaB
VPYARGKNRSLCIEDIVKQVKLLVQKGFTHICLTGVDLCSYQYGLANAVRAVLEEVPKLERLSFGSLDPAAVEEDLINLIAQNEKILPYLHLSVQSGDDLVLRRMGRRHRREDVINLCAHIRAIRPDVVFGADFICGFPGESEEAFENTCRLVCEAGIDKLHVFPYSEREGTPAAKMAQIDMHVRRERAQILRNIEGNKND